MRDALSKVIINFKSFIGTGWLMWLVFCVALVICFFFMKDKRKKLVTTSVIGCVIIINPLVYWLIGDRFLSGVYWRLFWVLPMIVLVAATLTEITGKLKREWLRVIGVGVLCIVILLTGKSVINRGTYEKAQNEYQIPQEAIEVSNLIREDYGDGNVMTVMPDDLVCYIRQYDDGIRMAYGRNAWGFMNVLLLWQQELFDIIHAENIDFKTLGTSAATYGCQYIVLNENLTGLPEDGIEGYQFIGNTDVYYIYALEGSK